MPTATGQFRITVLFYISTEQEATFQVAVQTILPLTCLPFNKHVNEMLINYYANVYSYYTIPTLFLTIQRKKANSHVFQFIFCNSKFISRNYNFFLSFKITCHNSTLYLAILTFFSQF